MSLFICQLGFILAAIFRTNSMEVATQEATPDTLCLFDIDMVLMQPRNPAFQIPNMKKYNYRRFTKGLTEEQKAELQTRISVDGYSTLVEANTPCVLRRLADRGIALAALTKTLTEKPYQAEKIERLRKLGIRFRPLCSEEIIFTNLPKFNGTYPTYRSGILFSNDCSKGDLLVDFLNRTELCPKKIIFIDDKRNNVEDVERALKGCAIEYFGYQYTAAYDYPSEEISQEEFDASWQKLIDQVID